MSFTLRLMTAADLPFVYQVQLEAYAGCLLESANIIAQRFSISPTTAWVAEREGRACAYLVAYGSTLGKINFFDAPFTLIDNATCLYLHDLAIAKDAQGYGIGKQLFNMAEAHAKKHNLNAMALLSVQNSKFFWQSLGFSEVLNVNDTQQKIIKTYLNDGEEAFYMVKQLLHASAKS